MNYIDFLYLAMLFFLIVVIVIVLIKREAMVFQKIFKYGGDGKLESVELYTAACLNGQGVSRHRYRKP
jgi:hypothetical protein